MKSSRPLLLLSVVASAIFLLASLYVVNAWLVVFKVTSIALLAALGFRVNVLLGSALALGAVGDFLLGVRRLGSLDAEKLFLFGLGAFLVGHLVYIVMFRSYWVLHSRKVGPARLFDIFAVLIALGSVLLLLRNSLGPLLIPVVLYALILAAMAISALLADLGNSLAAIGALCFVASDAMLAIGKFHGAFPAYDPVIWVTYYIAQLFIFLGVARASTREPVRP